MAKGSEKAKEFEQQLQAELAWLEGLEKDRQTRMQQNKAHLKTLESQLQDLQGMAAAKKESLSKRVADISGLKGEIQMIRTETDSQLHKKEEYNALVHKVEGVNGDTQKEIDTWKDKTAVKLQTLEEDAAWYKETLGVEIKKAPGDQLALVFRNISPADPSYTCCVWIKLDAERKYTVPQTKPEVSGLSAMVEELNGSLDLPGFFSSVRAKFQAAVGHNQ